MAAASTPPSFYSSMAQAQPAGAPPAAPGGGDAGGQGGDPDSEIVQAVAKMFSVMKKIPKMKDGTQAYIDRAMAPLKEMVVDVLKKDPKDLDSTGGGDKPPAGADATPPAPPTPKPGEAVPA